MLQTGGCPKDGVAPAVESGNAIAQSGDAFTITVADLLATVENVVVHVGRNHQELVYKTDGKGAVVALPGVEHRHWDEGIAHAVGDDGDFRLARLVGIVRRSDLIASENVIKSIEHPGEIIGTGPRFGPVRQIVIDFPFGGPREEDTNAQAVRAGE